VFTNFLSYSVKTPEAYKPCLIKQPDVSTKAFKRLFSVAQTEETKRFTSCVLIIACSKKKSTDEMQKKLNFPDFLCKKI
jgi:hypothetical protein